MKFTDLTDAIEKAAQSMADEEIAECKVSGNWGGTREDGHEIWVTSWELREPICGNPVLTIHAEFDCGEVEWTTAYHGTKQLISPDPPSDRFDIMAARGRVVTNAAYWMKKLRSVASFVDEG